MLKFLPSTIAAASVLLAQRTLRAVEWSSKMERYTQYSEAALAPCVGAMSLVLSRAEAASLQAVRKKYSGTKYDDVASIPFVPRA